MKITATLLSSFISLNLLTVLAAPAPAPVPATTTLPNPSNEVFHDAYQFCNDLSGTYGTQIIRLATSILGRDEIEEREIEERANLSPVLLGRTYNIVPGSKGHRSNREAYFGIGGCESSFLPD